jgi:hypothetical protein
MRKNSLLLVVLGLAILNSNQVSAGNNGTLAGNDGNKTEGGVEGGLNANGGSEGSTRTTSPNASGGGSSN